MKINKESLIAVFISICLFVIILLINSFIKKGDIKLCDEFELEDVLLEINLATNNEFTSVSTNDIAMYIPVELNENMDYIFANTSESEYFILARNLSSDKIEELKDYVDYNKKEIKFVIYDEYAYMINSNNYDSTIEGIIRSYIYCQ